MSKNTKYVNFNQTSNSLNFEASTHPGGLVEVINFNSIVDGLAAADGAGIKLSKMKVHVHTSCSGLYALIPVLVQTAGSISAANDEAWDGWNVNDILDAKIDDVFGYEIPKNIKLAKPTSLIPSSAFQDTFSFDLPTRILKLLEKETETERLQSLRLAIIVLSWEVGSGVVISIESMIETHYEKQAKNIVIR